MRVNIIKIKLRGKDLYYNVAQINLIKYKDKDL
jgi:hypothetical protein